MAALVPTAQPQRRGVASLLALAAGLVLAAAAPVHATPDPATWQAHAFPAMPAHGCVAGDWLAGALYLVRTPSCSLDASQDVTFERYTPAAGRTEVLAHLGGDHHKAAAKVVAGKVYIFSPNEGRAVSDQVFDPVAGTLRVLSSAFPGCSVDAPSFVHGLRITFVSNCVWSCSFIVFDAATESWRTLAAQLPGAPGQAAKLGLFDDGAVAHILVADLPSRTTRFYDFDDAKGTLAPGDVVDVPSAAGPLTTTSNAGALLPVWTGPLRVQMMSYAAATRTWTLEPGVLATAPTWWALGAGWAYRGVDGAVECVSPGTACDLAPAQDDAPVPPVVLVPTERSEPTAAPAGPDWVSSVDSDGDGVADDGDNCPHVRNAAQTDLDGDGLGDACDDDRDGDLVPEAGQVPDNCPDLANPDQTDADGNGLGDACTLVAAGTTSAHAAIQDVDGDGVDDRVDVCPRVPDPSQADRDFDAIGDACDGDRDGDGVAERHGDGAFDDNCPDTPNTDQADTDGDGRGDACSLAGSAPVGRSRPTPAAAAVTPASAPDVLVPVLVTVGVAAAAAGATVTAVHLQRAGLLAGLFSRHLGDPRAHKARARILEAVTSQPGIHFNELARQSGQGRGAARHHLGMLERSGLVRAARTGQYLCVYLADGPAAQPLEPLRSDTARQVADMVRQRPGVTAAEAARHLGVTYGAVSYHLRRLAEHGLVRLEDGPLTAYPTPALPERAPGA